MNLYLSPWSTLELPSKSDILSVAIDPETSIHYAFSHGAVHRVLDFATAFLFCGGGRGGGREKTKKFGNKMEEQGKKEERRDEQRER